MTNTLSYIKVFNNDDYDEELRDLFENEIENANIIWMKSFNRSYDRYCCPAEYLVMGYNDKDELLCCAVYEFIKDNYLLSSIGSMYENIGNGSKFIKEIYNYIKNAKSVEEKYILLCVDKDENEIKLDKFYTKNGYIKTDNDIINKYNLHTYCNEEEEVLYYIEL